jgi:integrase
MPKARLTAAFCANAACEEGKPKTTFWDEQISGFVLEVRPTSKTYALRFIEENGTQRQHKIARYEDVTFDQARKTAKRLRSEVVLGGSPAAQKEERKAVPTYSTLAAQHVEHAKSYQKSWWSTEGIIRRHLVPRWGSVRLTDIRNQDVAKWLGEKAAEGLKPATVEKIRVVFGRSFELARQWGIPGSAVNPVRGISRPRYDNARQRYLTAEEAKRLKWACELSANTQLGSIVGLLLLTGARKTELLQAKWADVDLERQRWFIPETKNGKSRHVPLSQAAIDVLAKVPRLPNCPWVLPNPNSGRPFVTLKRAWQVARQRADLSDLRIHDLRHSAASFMINGGIDLYAVGRILGHRDHASTMRYAHLANETLLRAVEAGAAGLNAEWAARTT